MGLVIGITGTLGSGKGTVVDYLVNEKGFVHFSVRAYLIEEIKKRGMPVNRDSMVIVANDLRAKHSPSYLAEALFEQACKQDKPAIIESLRTPGEIESLRKKGDFYLVAVDAKPEIRYERVVVRGSETDKISYEEFLGNEQREMSATDPNKQNLAKCMEMADYRLDNSGSLDDFNKHIEDLYKKVQDDQERKEYVRPSWDEYFVELTSTVARRATCNRGRSGCVIARDRHILVTGYVSSPAGLVNCDQVGHQMKSTIHEDGHISQHCVRTVHAEQNAICQAAKLGVPLQGATVYCKMTPCRTCAMLIINCGIKKVVCQKDYHAGGESKQMFKDAGVVLDILDETIEQYKNQ